MVFLLYLFRKTSLLNFLFFQPLSNIRMKFCQQVKLLNKASVILCASQSIFNPFGCMSQMSSYLARKCMLLFSSRLFRLFFLLGILKTFLSPTFPVLFWKTGTAHGDISKLYMIQICFKTFYFFKRIGHTKSFPDILTQL